MGHVWDTYGTRMRHVWDKHRRWELAFQYLLQALGSNQGFTMRNELIFHRTITRVVKLTNVRFYKAS